MINFENGSLKIKALKYTVIYTPATQRHIYRVSEKKYLPLIESLVRFLLTFQLKDVIFPVHPVVYPNLHFIEIYILRYCSFVKNEKTKTKKWLLNQGAESGTNCRPDTKEIRLAATAIIKSFSFFVALVTRTSK